MNICHFFEFPIMKIEFIVYIFFAKNKALNIFPIEERLVLLLHTHTFRNELVNVLVLFLSKRDTVRSLFKIAQDGLRENLFPRFTERASKVNQLVNDDA